MNKLGRIYGIFDNIKNKIVYIGKTKNLNDYKPHGKHIHKLFNLYPNRYLYKIIETDILLENLEVKEIEYIKIYNTFEDSSCFNFTIGGTGGYTLQKYNKKQIDTIRQKAIITKKLHPEIMKNSAKKARITFNNKPREFINMVNNNRGINAAKTRMYNKTLLTDQELSDLKIKHSVEIKKSRDIETIEQRKYRNDKITKTLRDKFPVFTCRNLITNDIKSLNSTQWLKLHKVHIWHLVNKYQHKCHNWIIV
jgi:hypothetical protein